MWALRRLTLVFLKQLSFQTQLKTAISRRPASLTLQHSHSMGEEPGSYFLSWEKLNLCTDTHKSLSRKEEFRFFLLLPLLWGLTSESGEDTIAWTVSIHVVDALKWWLTHIRIWTRNYLPTQKSHLMKL